MALLWRRGRRRRVRRSAEAGTMRHIFWGIGLFVLIALLLTGVWYLTRLPFVTISTVSIEGGQTVSHEELRSVIERELAGSYFLLVPRRFLLTYPKTDIYEALRGVPRIHDFSVERVDTTLDVTFEEYIPHALLCESGFETASCYFLDTSGYVFSPAPALRGGAFVRHVIEDTEVKSGMQAFDPTFIAKMDGFIDALESELGFRVTLVTHKASRDITYHLSEGGRLFVSHNMSNQEVFENLQSVLASEAFRHLKPGTFNYIDLRFGNKIFVNEELEMIATSSEPTPSEDASFTVQ